MSGRGQEALSLSFVTKVPLPATLLAEQLRLSAALGTHGPGEGQTDTNRGQTDTAKSEFCCLHIWPHRNFWNKSHIPSIESSVILLSWDTVETFPSLPEIHPNYGNTLKYHLPLAQPFLAESLKPRSSRPMRNAALQK